MRPAVTAPRNAGLTALAVALHDLFWAATIMTSVLVVRYEFEPKPLPLAMVLHATAVFTVLAAGTFYLARLHLRMWRFTALNDVVMIGQAVAFANMLLFPVLFLVDRLEDFPRTAVFIEAPILWFILALARVLVKAIHRGDLFALGRFEDRSRAPVLVVGSLEAADRYLEAARRAAHSPPPVAGVVCPDGAPHGRRLQGARVYGGLDRLGEALALETEAAGRPPLVVVADPRPGKTTLEAVVKAASDAGARVERLRDGAGRAEPDLSALNAVDLLDRPPRRLDLARARGMIEGRRLLITGAGGTIGGELTRQARRFDPAHLVLVDSAEYNLYEIDRELSESGAGAAWTAALGDVRDEARLKALFDVHRPEVVMHAAALKHVPLMELNPTEAVLTNVGGALNVARLAAGRSRELVFISTDKAVNPSNVMGATKRLAEQVVRAVCEPTPTRAAVVRFGNVLGSNGSVAPLFERQIAAGGPVTVTDPNIERYFMTIQEAASLVLQAAALPIDTRHDGGVYVLDMGSPVLIDELARQMIRLHGLQPGADIEIRYTGLRPGEKLYEEIFYAEEEVHPTPADGVLMAHEPASSWQELEGPVNALLAAALRRDEAETLERLHALVPGFQRP
jgi:O-antigen biosynthesis protein WbqV